MHTCALSLACTFVFTAVAAADWPQYLGPTRDGRSPETGLLRAWPEAGPKVLWTAEVGEGFSGPAVSEGKVYFMERLNDEKDALRSLDLTTGTDLWQFTYEAPGALSHGGGRTVPSVEGDRVYVCGPLGHLHCVDAKSRQAVWQANIWTDFGGGDKMPMWKLGQNPLVYQDLVLVAAQTPKTGLVAFDKLTGQVKWTTEPLPGRPGYVSPCVVTLAGVDQVVAISGGPPRRDLFRGPQGGQAAPSQGPGGNDRPRPERADDPAPVNGVTVGLDPASGRTLWSYEGWQCQTPVPNVIAIGEDRLFLTGGYGAGSALIQIQKTADGFSVTELLTTQDFGTHVHPPVLHEGHLYGHCADNTGRADGMVCMDLAGNVKWKTKRSPAFDKGGMLWADGLILTVDGVRGLLYLIEPSPEGFKALARAELLETPKCWAPLALVDGKLLIRDQKQMKCVAVK